MERHAYILLKDNFLDSTLQISWRLLGVDDDNDVDDPPLKPCLSLWADFWLIGVIRC